GRVVSNHDQLGSDAVVMIDETLARQYWPNEDPIGKHMGFGNRAPWWTIVGVVGHVKSSDLAGDVVKGKYYLPLFQRPIPFATFVVRASSDASRLGVAMLGAVSTVGPSVAVSYVRYV